MTESLERELELVKLQIAANDCLAEAQVYFPLLPSIAVVLFVFEFSMMLQYPSSYFANYVLPLMALGLMAALAILLLVTVIRYRHGVRKLDEYVEDFRAGKPLPSVTTMCGMKEKKARS